MPLQQAGSALPPQSTQAQCCALRTSRPCTARHCHGYANGPGPGPCLWYAGSRLTSCGLKSCWPDSAPQLLMPPRPNGPMALRPGQKLRAGSTVQQGCRHTSTVDNNGHGRLTSLPDCGKAAASRSLSTQRGWALTASGAAGSCLVMPLPSCAAMPGLADGRSDVPGCRA